MDFDLPDFESQDYDDPRIAEMTRNIWVGYERAIHIRRELGVLVNCPPNHRPPCAAIVGNTNNGKSMLLHSFKKRYAPVADPNAEKTLMPVVVVQTPKTTDVNELYDRILAKVSIGHRAKEKEGYKESRIAEMFKNLGVRVLVMDDFFNFGFGPLKRRQLALNALRNMTTDLQLSIVVSGTPEIINILSSDHSLLNRFEIYRLPRWKIDTDEDFMRFAQFILSVEPVLLLKEPCSIAQNSNAVEQIHAMSEGLIGETVNILRKLAKAAILSGRETVDGDKVTAQYIRSLGYRKPSERPKIEE